VTVINFNYDRTFEQFLFSRLQTNFDLDEEEAAKIVSEVVMTGPD